MNFVVEIRGGDVEGVIQAKCSRPDRFSSQPVGLRKAGAQYFQVSIFKPVFGGDGRNLQMGLGSCLTAG